MVKLKKKTLSFLLVSVMVLAMVLALVPIPGAVAYAGTSEEPIVYLTADPNNKDFVCGQPNTQNFTVFVENFYYDCDWGIAFFLDAACTKEAEPISITEPIPGITYNMDSKDPSWNPLDFEVYAMDNGSKLKGGTYYVRGYFFDPYKGEKGTYYWSSTIIPMVIQKVDQDGPKAEDFTTENETWDNFVSGNKDGSISGLTTKMEVSADDGKTWTSAQKSTLDNISAGTYQIRYATTDTKKASPACNVEVKASYKVTNFSDKKGSVSAPNTYYEAGETVELTASAAEGELFETVSYTDKNGTHVITPNKDKYSFEMPASAVILSATFVVPHVHDWTYEANGATITAVCKGSGICDATDTTLTILAPELTTYGGNENAAATLSAKSLAGQSALPVIHYARKTASGTYEELKEAPTAAGSYKAFITVNNAGVNVTAFVDYTIAKKTINVKANDQTSAAGSELVALTYTADKLVGTDKFTGSLATNADKNTAGKYEITQGTLTAGDNYSIVFTKGTYEVTAVNSATAAAKTGDTNNPGMYVLIIAAALGAIFAATMVYKKKRAK